VRCAEATRRAAPGFRWAGRNRESAPLSEERSSPPPQDPFAAQADFAKLRQDLTRAVARVCPSWLSDQTDDLVQVALIRVIDAGRRSEGEGPYSPSYLRKAAYSAVVDEIRRRRRRREVALEEEDGTGDELVQVAANPEQRLRGREAGQAIRDCLQRLIRPRKLAVTLHLQGHSVPEVARVLGWNVKRAENLVYRGLADLRECLDGKGITS